MDELARKVAWAQAASELWDKESWAPDEIAYMAHVFAQMALPYRDPGPGVESWVRRNGDQTLTVQAAPGVGFPFGTKPRLLLVWLTTEAVRTKSRDLTLGTSLSEFMRGVGLIPSGGRNGSIRSLQTQLERLFLARMILRHHSADHQAAQQMIITDEYELWWDRKDIALPSLISSHVRLSERFYDQVVGRAIPVSVGALQLLQQQRSPMALDIYVWLTYRMSYLRRRSQISWASLRLQFGSQYADTRTGRFKFKQDFERNLGIVGLVYPGARFDVQPEGLVLYRSPPSVPKLQAVPRLQSQL